MRQRVFLVALLLGLLVRLATLPLPGHDDVITWKIWSYAAAHDVTAMYGVGGTPPTRGIVTWGERWSTVDYPPVFLYEYAIVGRTFGALFPDYPDGVALLVAVKLPILFANAGMTWLLFAAVRRMTGRLELTWGSAPHPGSAACGAPTPRAAPSRARRARRRSAEGEQNSRMEPHNGPAQWAALAYWLNPATIFGGEMLGYVDPLFTLPALAGLILACHRRYWWAGVLVALAVGTKPQGLLVGPAFALVLWHAGGLPAIASAGATFALALAVIVLPFYIRGAVDNMLLGFGAFYQRRDTMSAYAANIGWIVNWVLRSTMGFHEIGWRAYLAMVPRPLAISRFIELGYPNPRPICTTAVAAAIAWAVWVTRRASDLAIASAVGAFTVHAFFVLNVGVHESHQLFEIPLLVLAAALRPRLRPLMIVVSAIVTLNINYYYGISIGWGWAVPRTLTGVDLSVVLAFINVIALAWFAATLAREAAIENKSLVPGR